MYFSSYSRASIAAVIAALFCVSAYSQSQIGFSRQINGQVRYADSKAPAANVIVRVEGFSGGVAGEVVTDRTGKFAFGGLHAEQYRVTFHSPGYNDIEEIVDLMTAPTGLINALLVRDRSSLSTDIGSGSGTSGVVIDANVPVPAQEEYHKGKAVIDAGDSSKINEAIQHLEKAIAIFPKYFAAQMALGLAEMDVKSWSKAEKPLQSAIEIRPDASTPYFALGEVYRREKKYSEAEKVLLEGVKLSPDSAEGHTTLGEVYTDMAPSSPSPEAFRNRLESSWKEAATAIKLKPSYAPAHLLAGNLLLKARRPKDALGHYEEYLKLDPKGPFVSDAKEMVRKIKQALAQSGEK
jgi:Tfp pilus assembly protein PilF